MEQRGVDENSTVRTHIEHDRRRQNRCCWWMGQKKEVIKEVEQLDVNVNRWVNLPSMSKGRSHHTSSVWNEHTIVVSGGMVSPKVLLFDTRTSKWSKHTRFL